jgi:hypothetical protein
MRVRIYGMPPGEQAEKHDGLGPRIVAFCLFTSVFSSIKDSDSYPLSLITPVFHFHPNFSFKMATITSSTTKVILAVPSDWREWFQLIKSSAGYARVWEYVNPDTKPEDLPVLREPEYPTPRTINRKATTFAELSEEEQEELKEQRKEYRRIFKLYEKKTDALYEISKNIQGSIDRSILYLIEDKLKPRDMLISLKERLAPTEIVR